LNKFPQIREALIHVEGAFTEEDSPYPEEFKILPSQSTVIADIKRVLKKFPEVRESEYFTIHYLREEVNVFFSIVLDMATSVSDAQRIGRLVRIGILQEISYITEATINYELAK